MLQLMDFLFAALCRVTEMLVANCSLTDGTRRDGFVLPSFGSLQFSVRNSFCRGRRIPDCFLGALLGKFQVFNFRYLIYNIQVIKKLYLHC